MSQQRDLAVLLREMAPRLASPHYVFCSFADHRLPDGLDPICLFREAEGLTAIVEKAVAESRCLPYSFESRLITLEVHSDLAAVGFLSSVSTALAEAGIACNAVSAFYHDHLFVPVQHAARAMAVLHSITTGTAPREGL
ncbi:MAG TPA: ACT domain-containing protein [Trinickia sp.]|uniref:ACT domain-containing protein n=1 Tax=Trinickia sp. TaxID=2571163 RepID=UPI002CD8539D|nr:ACT domain-containing protein [Trinickia sp.]HVW51493.1 ACT domain-containing protein [Trinickia sp.]